MNPIRTTTLGLGALLLLGMAVSPSAQAFVAPPLPDLDQPQRLDLCPTPNPEAWVNYCVEVIPYATGAWAYEPDTTPETTLVCPLPSTCVNVPIILELVDEKFYSATLYRVAYTITPNGSQIYEDVCDVIGLYCSPLKPILESLAPISSESTTASSSMPHGLQLQSLGDVDADGAMDLAFFLSPDGKTIVLPLA